MHSIHNLGSRSRGIFLGAAVGDALGWPQEQNSSIVGGNKSREVEPSVAFRSWQRYAGGQYRRYVDPVTAGEYSDDTQLLLATARALLAEDWWSALTTAELPQFPLYQRGSGGATLRACRSWAAGIAPWAGGPSQKAARGRAQYFAAGGNGVAMRIAPHVVVYAEQDRSALVARVVRDGIATHGHPRALVGAALYACALQILLTSSDTLKYGELTEILAEESAWQYPEAALAGLPTDWRRAAGEAFPDIASAWNDAARETRALLERVVRGTRSGTLSNDRDVLEDLGSFDRRVNGAGTVSAVGAVYLASRSAPRPHSGLVRAAFLSHADTDTLASMTAALLGALHGIEWLQQLAPRVQDAEYIAAMADRCAAVAVSGAPRTLVARRVRDGDLQAFRRALSGSASSVAALPDGRPVTVASNTLLGSSTNHEVTRWRLVSEGQTIIVDVPADTSSAARVERASTGSVRRISLLAPDLNALERFYGARGLGLHVARSDAQELLVDGIYRFVHSVKAVESPSSVVYLEIEVDDIQETLSRLSFSPGVAGGAVRLKDPAGNDVGLSQRKR